MKVRQAAARSEPFVARRGRLAATLRAHGGGVAIVPTAPERQRNHDNDHPYRHDSGFHYLTGFAEPDAWLVLAADGRSTLVCRPKDNEREIWDGHRLGPEAAPAALGIDAAYPLDKLDEVMLDLLADQPAVWLPAGTPGLQARLDGWLQRLRARSGRGIETPRTQHDLAPVLAEMRVIKDPAELETMRRAAAISAGAHARAMRFCAARFAADPHAGIAEYEIEAELLHEFRRHGADGPAYGSIVAAGSNACVLHHLPGRAELRPGQLCLIDAGCELDGYASDITRTFPADGRFTPAQRELYDIVAAAQQAAIAATRPGARHRDAHIAAVRVLAQGMLDTGLLERSKVGDVDAVVESSAYRAFYMHGTGHWLGRDVHDAGSYVAADEAPVEQPDWQGGRVVRRPSRKLEPGMVVTVEPGLYVRPAEGVPERFWNIGIRIEDDAIVTVDGCELISRGAPVAAL
ncbi:MAG: aminopeptidase P N-terminal domain-containing protein, partial [Pseudomonadota bacterium]|nr:aminopeptidase P N-terminal domain-containing protein [Pseudomonadota bacterium]